MKYSALNILLLLGLCGSIGAENRDDVRTSSDHASQDYGLKPDDARRFERAIGQGGSPAADGELLSRRRSDSSVETSANISTIEIALWPYVLIGLLIVLSAVMYFLGRRLQRRRSTEAEE